MLSPGKQEDGKTKTMSITFKNVSSKPEIVQLSPVTVDVDYIWHEVSTVDLKIEGLRCTGMIG